MKFRVTKMVDPYLLGEKEADFCFWGEPTRNTLIAQVSMHT